MVAQLVVIIVVIAFDGCVLDRAVHSFDLAVGPGMIDLGESVFDTGLAATQSEHVRHTSRVRRICLSRWQTELDAIIGEHRMDFVGNGFDQGDQEGRCGDTIGFFGKLDEGELRSSVDRHEEVEFSLGGLHFGDVDVEEADRIGLELFLCRLVAFDLSKTADPMPLQTTIAMRLHPLDPRTYATATAMAFAYFFSDRTEDASRWATTAVRQQP